MSPSAAVRSIVAPVIRFVASVIAPEVVVFKYTSPAPALIVPTNKVPPVLFMYILPLPPVVSALTFVEATTLM